MAVLFRRKTFVPRVSQRNTHGFRRYALRAYAPLRPAIAARYAGRGLRVKRELRGLSSSNDGVSIVLCYKWIMARSALNKAFLS